MANLALLHLNYADAATLSGGSWAMPLSNLQSVSLGAVARSTNMATASTQMTADLGAVRAVGGVALGPVNIGPGAQFRIRASNVSNFASLLADTGWLSATAAGMDWSDTSGWLAWEDIGFWTGTLDAFNRDLGATWLFTIFPADVVARYVKFEVDDPNNVDGYLQASRLLIAKAFRPSVNYAVGAEMGVTPIFQRLESIGGQRFDWDLNRRRTLRVTFPLLNNGELFGDIFRIQYVTGVTSHVFVVADPDDTSNLYKRSFLATFRSAPPIVQAYNGGGNTTFDLEEVLG